MSELTKFEGAALEVLAHNRGIYPSAFAGLLMEKGVMKQSKRRLTRQGLGFAGGRILWRLWRKGFAIEAKGGWEVTREGATWVGTHGH